jgi:hypothetical protein
VKLREILSEVRAGKLSRRYQQTTRGVNVYSDGEKSSGDYTEYRLGLALACSDGKTPIDIDPKTWYGKKKLAFPYTELEQDMLKQGYKAVGANYKDLNKGDLRSQELESTNKVSPIAKPKRNQYGI